jgi:hypothetical protein
MSVKKKTVVFLVTFVFITIWVCNIRIGGASKEMWYWAHINQTFIILVDIRDHIYVMCEDETVVIDPSIDLSDFLYGFYTLRDEIPDAWGTGIILNDDFKLVSAGSDREFGTYDDLRLYVGKKGQRTVVKGKGPRLERGELEDPEKWERIELPDS